MIFSVTFPPGRTVSEGLRDLLTKMLEKDPKKRIKLGDLKQHLWLSENPTQVYDLIMDENDPQGVIVGLFFVNLFRDSFLLSTRLLNMQGLGLCRLGRIRACLSKT
jgi:hypothetical protein